MHLLFDMVFLICITNKIQWKIKLYIFHLLILFVSILSSFFQYRNSFLSSVFHQIRTFDQKLTTSTPESVMLQNKSAQFSVIQLRICSDEWNYTKKCQLMYIFGMTFARKHESYFVKICCTIVPKYILNASNKVHLNCLNIFLGVMSSISMFLRNVCESIWMKISVCLYLFLFQELELCSLNRNENVITRSNGEFATS